MTIHRRTDGFQPFAVVAASGPRVTPQAGVRAVGRYWTTTSRQAWKRRHLARRPVAGTAVNRGQGLVVQSGRATVYDLLAPADGLADPIGWSVSGAAIGRLGLAHLRQVAGYAGMITAIPGEWNVAGRVLIAVRPDHTVTIEGNEITDATGNWRRGQNAPEITRPTVGTPVDASVAPDPVRALLDPGASPECSLAYLSPDGPVAVPATWDPATGRASVTRCLVEHTGRLPGSAIAITLDGSAGPRPIDKHGLMLRGRGVLMNAPDPSQVSFAVGQARLDWWMGFESNPVATR